MATINGATAAPACQITPFSDAYTGGVYTYKYPGQGAPKLTLDYYRPVSTAATPGLVVLIHGGGFTRGSSEDRPMIHEAQSLVGLGYAVASLDYSLVGEQGPARDPGNVFPQSVHDVFCAIKWLKLNAATLGFDANRIGVLGHSAGGYLAAMIGVVGRDQTSFDRTFGIDNTCSLRGVQGIDAGVRAVALYYPITDLYSLIQDPDLSKGIGAKAFMGAWATSADALKAASPARLVFGNSELPPFMVVHGDLDQMVPGIQSQEFTARLAQTKHIVAGFTVPGLNHGFYPLSIDDTLVVENATPYGLGLTRRDVRDALAPSTCFLEAFLASALAR